ncbi:MAG: tRNA (adenosine(37)-N6)-dimethylallyltransferase MiaA [Planctomycetia bacterium]|nr:tRNA (adenosine(37)-N6)-dimethylallyltransferase MiaA [Planctomycetia bacterium]
MAPDDFSTVACPGADAARAGPPPAPRLAADCWFLSGPTAAGKTALALDLARRLDAEVVSVDSMAVYRGLDIGTAKPSAAERAAVPHHVVDVVAPSERYSVARWLAAAAAAVEEIRLRGRRVLFVGGTPLYLRALRDGLAPLPPADAAYRRALEAEVAATGNAPLHARLATVIHPHDTKRIVRALEVVHATGRPLSAAFAPAPHPVFESQFLVVDLPRRLLHDRIDRRVEAMFARGLVGTLSVADAIRRTQDRTRQLAKRQLTWLRSFRHAVWVTA